MSDKSPLGRLTNRVTKTAYFREGKDRASNDWHKECDLLVVLGTPRVPPTAILNQLIRMGDIKSAEQDGQWEDRRWEAETPSGRRRVVKGSGYCNASWQKAHETVVKAALLQAVGRARSNLDDGIPVLVFSNEPLGLPVEDEQEALKPLSENALRSVAWFEEQIAYNLNNSIYTFCNFGTGDMAIAWKQKTDLVSRTLGQLADAGYLTKLAHGRWGVTRLLEQHCP